MYNTDEEYDRLAYKTLKRMGMNEPEPKTIDQLARAIQESAREVNDENKVSQEAILANQYSDADPFLCPEEATVDVNMLTSRGRASHPGERWFAVGRTPMGKSEMLRKILQNRAAGTFIVLDPKEK